MVGPPAFVSAPLRRQLYRATVGYFASCFWLGVLVSALGAAAAGAALTARLRGPCPALRAVRPLCLAAKLILIASNCPPLRKSELEYYAMLSKTEVHHFSGGRRRLVHVFCTWDTQSRRPFTRLGNALSLCW